MEDVTMEQVIQMAQNFVPQMDPEMIIQKFEELKKVLPEGMSNLEIAQVAFKAFKDQGQPSKFGALREKIGR